MKVVLKIRQSVKAWVLRISHNLSKAFGYQRPMHSEDIPRVANTRQNQPVSMSSAAIQQELVSETKHSDPVPIPDVDRMKRLTLEASQRAANFFPGCHRRYKVITPDHLSLGESPLLLSPSEAGRSVTFSVCSGPFSR